MRSFRLPALAAALLLGAASLNVAPAQAASGRIVFKVGDTLRSAVLVERSRLKRKLRPVLIVFHNGTRTASLARRGLRFDRFATNGGVLVYADAPAGAWNIGADGKATAELAYVNALVRRLVADSLGDPRRIYLVGVGSGGIVALQAACRDGKSFAGVSALLAGLPPDELAACAPAHPLATMLVAGTADKRVPFEGGVADLPDYKGPMASAEATIGAFAQANGCGPKRGRTEAPDRDRADGSRAIIEAYPSCKAPVRLVRIEGGDHFAPSRTTGTRTPGQNRDVSSTNLVLSFFRLPGRDVAPRTAGAQ
ncbi:MAG: phospholipase/carboxylesterase [Hyphomicrobiales bacterium]|nr:phospholipase/carboxylesterase [Hyphomicrobiales bacterium]